MKHPNTTIILTILVSIGLFVFGIFSFGNIYETLLPKVDNGFYQVTELDGQFKTSLIFSLVLSLTPIFIWLTWRVASITLIRNRIFSILTVVVCMILAILLRQQSIKFYFRGLSSHENASSDNIRMNYPIDTVHFEYYLLGGLCVGCIISYFLFRQKKS